MTYFRSDHFCGGRSPAHALELAGTAECKIMSAIKLDYFLAISKKLYFTPLSGEFWGVN
jgi:hypothetical protein